MDTSALKRELETNKASLETASQTKRRLENEIASLKPKVASYKRDYEEVETKLTTKIKELEDIVIKMSKYSLEINKLDRDFKKMMDDLKRAQANSSSAPNR